MIHHREGSAWDLHDGWVKFAEEPIEQLLTQRGGGQDHLPAYTRRNGGSYHKSELSPTVPLGAISSDRLSLDLICFDPEVNPEACYQLLRIIVFDQHLSTVLCLA